MNKKEIPSIYRGSKNKPVTTTRDLMTTMVGRKDIVIYVKYEFTLNERILAELKIRNIELKKVDDK